MTQRLVLAPLELADAAALFAYRSDPDVGRYQTWAPATLHDAETFIRDLGSVAFGTPDTWIQLGIHPTGQDLLIGDVGIHFSPNESREVEIGVTLAPEHQGLGYATEAIRALLGYLFGTLGKHRVTASVDPRNQPSMALLERVGMRQEAHFRQSLWFKGEWADDVVYAMLESEWKA